MIIEHKYKDHLRIFAHAAPSAVATAVLIHGGGWVGGSPLQFEHQFAAFAACGISSLSLEYRVRNTHGTTIYQSLADALDAMPMLARLCGRLPCVIIGASAGGFLAAHLLINGRMQAAGGILLNPVVDLSADGFVSKATPPGGDKAISPLHLPIERMPPLLLLQGLNDQVVPLDTLRRFVRRVTDLGIPAELNTVPNAGHGFFNVAPHLEPMTSRMIGFIRARASCA
jgi:acetyl esterase/lipase